MRRLLLLALCLSIAFISVAADALAGTVEGTVTPTAWAQEVEVCVVSSVSSETCASPAANGSYALPGVEGAVKLEFVPAYRSGLLTQYYNHKSHLSEAESVPVPPSGAKGIDADLVEGGVIEGVVRSTAGAVPLAEVEVCARPVEEPTLIVCGESDSSGAYALHSLPTGSYGIRFLGTGKSAKYEPLYQTVAVTAGKTTAGVDVTVAKGAQIDGVITAAEGGARLAGIVVCLFIQSAPAPARCAFSDEAGGYSFQGLSDGSYQVGFSLEADESGFEGGAGADGFESQFYEGVGTRAMASTISILAPTTIGGVDAVLRALPLPSASMAANPVAAATVPTPVTIAAPPSKKAGCKAPKRKKRVRRTVRWVKPVQHKSSKHHKPRRKKSSRGKQGRKR